jgi:hypothetical protein
VGRGPIKVWLLIDRGMRGSGIRVALADTVNGRGKLRAAE